MPAMEVLENAVRQAPRPCCSSTGPDLSGSCCLDQAVGSWDVLLVRGSGSWADHPPWICVVRLLSSAASGREVGTPVTCVQSLMENRKFGVLSSVGCCPLSKLQDLCYLVVAIFILKLGSRGVKCIILQCFFCIPKMRADNDLAKDGDSCSFGSIHRWQVKESSLLISRYNERGIFRMSSVKCLRNLQLIHLLPHVHMPARLPGELQALWRACIKEAFEDFHCGCAPKLSQLACHKTPVVIFPVFSLLFAVLVFTMCKGALIYALFLRIL